MPVVAVSLRAPMQTDARALHELAVASGNLDANSRYAYLLVCSHFAKTSVVAESDGSVVGFVSGYRLPEDSETLFVWQIAVEREHRGQGIAMAMLSALVEQQLRRGLRFIEATVSPGNAASRRLFDGLARHFSAESTETSGYGTALFLPQVHDPEPLIRIGPFAAAFSRNGQL